MFKSLVTASDCTVNGHGKLIQRKLSEIYSEILEAQQQQLAEGRIIYPTAFIFHESRVGSTLLANILAKDPLNLVYSESSPPVSALFCDSCSESTAISRLINVITLMGRSPYHQRLFFKFQSIMTTKIHIILKAYPDVPWIFLYRKPVQVLMSHVSPWKIKYLIISIATALAAAPCLRSKSSDPPMMVSEGLSQAQYIAKNATNVAWCASHLYMLCKFALKAYNDHHLYDVSSIESHFRQHHYSSIQYIFAPQSRPLTGQMRGLLVDYAIVPGVLLSLIFPLWGLTLFVTPSFPHTSALLSFPLPSLLHNTTDISTLSALSPHILRAMQEQSLLYSKNGNRLGGGGNFRGDSTSKDGWANDDIVSLSEAILGKIFSTMKQKSAADLSILLDKNLHGKSDLQEEQLKLIPQPNIRLDPSFPMSEGIFTTTDRLTWTVPGLFETNYVSEPYTPVDCPSTPSTGYPATYPLSSILSAWNPHNTSIPSKHFRSLCTFDYSTNFAAASEYRRREVPFILTNHPLVNEVVQKWKNFTYLENIFGKTSLYRSEYSPNNHFMYWNGINFFKSHEEDEEGKIWVNPTEKIYLTFREWLEFAISNYDQYPTANSSSQEKNPYPGFKYFRVSGYDNASSPLFKELPIFQNQKSFFVVQPDNQEGIHCRFSMRSTIAECHYDSNRNFIINLGGIRRWILASPSQCDSLYLYPPGHPSSRHSKVNWAAPDYVKYPKFSLAQTHEVILKPGDILYLPTGWFHYIVSLNINYQCNSRSGTTSREMNHLRKCGF